MAIYNDYKNIEGFEDQLESQLGSLGIKVIFLKNKYPQHKTPLLVNTILNKYVDIGASVEESLKVSILDLETIYHLGSLIEKSVPYREKNSNCN